APVAHPAHVRQRLPARRPLAVHGRACGAGRRRVNGLSLSGIDQARPAPRDEVLRGLLSPQKELPCKLFYDAVGSELFERICELDEYSPTRPARRIMRA